MTTTAKKIIFNFSSIAIGFGLAIVLFPESGGLSSISYDELRDEFARIRNYENELRAYESELKEKATKLSSLIDSLQLPFDDEDSKQSEPLGVGGTDQDLSASVTEEDDFDASFKPTTLGGHSTAKTIATELKRLRAIPMGAPTIGKISSHYGKRVSPFSGRSQFHSGLDISAPRGTKVHAPADGTVVSSGWDGSYGKMVLVDHGYGLKTLYGHLSNISVKVGDELKRGDLIGQVGTTGRSTGAHLHYEVTLNDKHLDPMRFVKLAEEVKELTTGA